jgi:hypothetical protein
VPAVSCQVHQHEANGNPSDKYGDEAVHNFSIKEYNWLQVFKRAHTALLGSGGDPEQRPSQVPSEKCAVSWGSDDDKMRMITASFVRAIERFAGDHIGIFFHYFKGLWRSEKLATSYFIEVAELYMLNDRFLSAFYGAGYPLFSSPAPVKNNRLNGFFLTGP